MTRMRTSVQIGVASHFRSRVTCASSCFAALPPDSRSCVYMQPAEWEELHEYLQINRHRTVISTVLSSLASSSEYWFNSSNISKQLLE
ncbi:hypothetical protein PHYPO_G00173580 [Pangasianodon hypophthalmus]|uniref:Uncharacterized protein n=1 Tax=Pangasianodon hypophthalmus TaxID=310915 RepID=A0A5N5JFC9_PANHP|nr:hypothetical protein PHYPO_G00173580 [Pangasianodon hypophthalmus]